MVIKWTMVLLLVGALLMAGCTMPLGPEETTTERIELGEATRARVLVAMEVGELTIRGGATELMEAEFTYSGGRWSPQIGYAIADDTGQLEVRQPSTALPGVRVETDANIWHVRLSDNVPLSLLVQMGATQSQLNLASLSLEALDVEVGVGEARIDLTGNWETDISGHIVAGAQRLHLRLPSRTGVRVSITGSPEAVNTEGLQQDNGAWVNAAFNDDGPNLFLDIQAGPGPIDLEVVE
jgi:hypothetical protein